MLLGKKVLINTKNDTIIFGNVNNINDYSLTLIDVTGKHFEIKYFDINEIEISGYPQSIPSRLGFAIGLATTFCYFGIRSFQKDDQGKPGGIEILGYYGVGILGGIAGGLWDDSETAKTQGTIKIKFKRKNQK